ncbi:hypothetical protein Vafri_1833 [Volvox africanus]|nr:hypothetical protein Vafri_1833 [Volvox africanus]
MPSSQILNMRNAAPFGIKFSPRGVDVTFDLGQWRQPKRVCTDTSLVGYRPWKPWNIECNILSIMRSAGQDIMFGPLHTHGHTDMGNPTGWGPPGHFVLGPHPKK